MVAAERLPEPLLVDKVIAEPNKKLIGPRFKGDQKTVINGLEALDGDELDAFKQAIESKGSATLPGTSFEISGDLVSFKSEKRTIYEQKYTPGVVEPAFGVGRILYAVLEHAFSQRAGSWFTCRDNVVLICAFFVRSIIRF
jgi:glycyl-tRNA synthetase